jgi:hypothetical protein
MIEEQVQKCRSWLDNQMERGEGGKEKEKGKENIKCIKFLFCGWPPSLGGV